MQATQVNPSTQQRKPNQIKQTRSEESNDNTNNQTNQTIKTNPTQRKSSILNTKNSKTHRALNKQINNPAIIKQQTHIPTNHNQVHNGN